MSYQKSDWNMIQCINYANKLCNIRYFTVHGIPIEVINYNTDIDEPLLEDRVWVIYKRELYCVRYKESVLRFLEEIGQGDIEVDINKVKSMYRIKQCI